MSAVEVRVNSASEIAAGHTGDVAVPVAWGYPCWWTIVVVGSVAAAAAAVVAAGMSFVPAVVVVTCIAAAAPVACGMWSLVPFLVVGSAAEWSHGRLLAWRYQLGGHTLTSAVATPEFDWNSLYFSG